MEKYEIEYIIKGINLIMNKLEITDLDEIYNKMEEKKTNGRKKTTTVTTTEEDIKELIKEIGISNKHVLDIFELFASKNRDNKISINRKKTILSDIKKKMDIHSLSPEDIGYAVPITVLAEANSVNYLIKVAKSGKEQRIRQETFNKKENLKKEIDMNNSKFLSGLKESINKKCNI